MVNPKRLWSDERLQKLKAMWARGSSASEIARALGGFEHTQDGGRSAVIGKAHREQIKREIDTIHWSEDDIATLTLLWLRGHPAKEIAQKLGGEMTGGAVIAEAKRRGLQARGRVTYRRAEFGKPKPPARVRSADGVTLERLPMPEPTLEDLATPLAQRRTLLELSASTCKWPIGEPGEAGFFFCGAQPIDALPYCAAHCGRAFLRAAPVRDDGARHDAPSSSPSRKAA
jgi:GcrA cell cycle regulator